MLTLSGRAVTAFIGSLLLFAPGCALIPTFDDVASATKTVKDTVTGKARRDRQTQAFAEARIMERRQDYSGAEVLYRQLLVEKPGSRDCYHRLAVMAALQSKYEEADALYKQALACGSPTADLWNDVGYCHYLQHQMPDAEGAFRQALALTPQHRSAMNNLAMVIGQQGNLDEAYRLFRQANSEGEGEANFAYLCAQCGDLPRAQQHYSRALSCSPEMKNALDGLFQVTERMQRVQQAQAAQAQNQPNASPDGVQQVGHEAPVNEPRRPLIEVFTANTGRRAAAPDATTAPAPAPAPAPTPAAAAKPASPIPTSVPAAAPQPYSYQQPAQPQYLQPTSGPRSTQQPGAPPSEMNAPAPSAVQNAAGPFPSLR